MALTARVVEGAKPKEKGYKLGDGAGLYLFVSPVGGKSWRANFTVGGKQKTRTYGRYPRMSLADARKAHQEARSGPEATDTPIFKEVARQWLLKHLPSLANSKHRIQVENTLERFAYEELGSRPIGEIKRSDLVRVVQAVGKVETSHRVAGRITAVFDYAQDAGLIENHPAARLSRVLEERKVKRHMPSIPPGDAGQLMRAISTYPETVTRLGLQLAAHTFVRTQELLGMRWDEIKPGDLWVIPESRMKVGRIHVVPLSRQAREILKTLREMTDGPLVLPSSAKPDVQLSENTLLFALYRLGYRGLMTVHGFRALASTVLNEESGFPHDVIERQLAHKETDAVRAAYNRAQYLEARVKLVQWWSDWLERQTASR